MMKINIYQVNMDRDYNNLKFMSLERMEKYQGNSEVDSEIYDKIYHKEVECSTLEDIYRKFNTDHPEDFKGHSLSVSDVVEICESETVKPGFYFCDMVGFREIEFHPEECDISDRINEEHSTLSVLYIKPGEFPEIVEIEDTLEAKQQLVGGYIEMICPFEDDEIAVILNEEGKLEGLPLNRALYDDFNKKNNIIDIIAGNFFICSAPSTSDKFENLSNENAEKYKKLFMYPERFYRWGRDIVVEPYNPAKQALDELMKKAESESKKQDVDSPRDIESRGDYDK